MRRIAGNVTGRKCGCPQDGHADSARSNARSFPTRDQRSPQIRAIVRLEVVVFTGGIGDDAGRRVDKQRRQQAQDRRARHAEPDGQLVACTPRGGLRHAPVTHTREPQHRSKPMRGRRFLTWGRP